VRRFGEPLDLGWWRLLLEERHLHLLPLWRVDSDRLPPEGGDTQEKNTRVQNDRGSQAFLDEPAIARLLTQSC
jgi:hypothetical protein